MGELSDFLRFLTNREYEIRDKRGSLRFDWVMEQFKEYQK